MIRRPGRKHYRFHPKPGGVRPPKKPAEDEGIVRNPGPQAEGRSESPLLAFALQHGIMIEPSFTKGVP